MAKGLSLFQKRRQRVRTALRAKGGQRLDENGCFNRHMERPHHARALERLLRGVLRADGHQPRHFLL